MTGVDFGFDIVLAATLPLLAWRILSSDDHPKAVVLFIAFGFVSAIAWARLHAPDIALVEAAVGAGLTGALLVNALAWLGRTSHDAESVSRVNRTLLFVLASVVGVSLVTVILHVPVATGLAPAVEARLAETEIEYPVTAVLLNYRAYDTLLEIAVLVAAVLGARVHAPPPASLGDDKLAPHAQVLARLLGPVLVLVAAYLLWRGATAPGGAFQAAAVLAGGAILFVLARIVRVPRMSRPSARVVLLIGLGWFIAVAALPLALGGQLLEYPRSFAKELILSIELLLTISIAIVLVMFFPGEAPPSDGRARAAPEDRW